MLCFTYGEQGGSDDAPVDRPPIEQWEVHPLAADHGTDVVYEPFTSIDPGDGSALADSKYEKSETSSVAVHQVHPVDTGLPRRSKTPKKNDDLFYRVMAS